VRASDFFYELPEELIAQEPLADRSASRLLILHRETGEIEHRTFRDSIDFLNAGDLLVLNDTRVSAVRLLGKRASGGAVEALLLEDHGDGRFTALTRPAKKLREGERIELGPGLDAIVEQDLGGGKKGIAFVQSNYETSLARIGKVPLPPYIKASLADPERYQTVYSNSKGSAAAPTAGLHFTKELLDAIRAKGVTTAMVTLDVSLDTFRPITAENVEDHVMHGERCYLSEETAGLVNSCEGRVFAVGTTSVRTLESFAIGKRRVDPGTRVTDLFITPGYEFRVVEGLFTNFHMPGTTLMLLLSAFAGRENVLGAYRSAVENRYRFLSFGDAMLVV
jgi:S-adenosylmethionine:tRNA ribosyltransferase-isomerase